MSTTTTFRAEQLHQLGVDVGEQALVGWRRGAVHERGHPLSPGSLGGALGTWRIRWRFPCPVKTARVAPDIDEHMYIPTSNEELCCSTHNFDV